MTARILIPPGIGDSYWVLTKLPAFLKREDIEKPELTVVCYESPLGAHLRSVPYLELFDSFTLGDPPFIPNDPTLQAIWDEAYLGPGKSIFKDVMGFDYFIAYNGRINSGGWLEDDDLECDWYPKMLQRPEKYIQEYRKAFGRFAVLFWPFYGSYESHLADFSIEKIAESLNRFCDSAGLTPVFIGADWDIGLNAPVQDLMQRIPGAIDYIGKTSLIESFGLLMAADMVTGYHAGLTNMAAVFGATTLLLWDNRYPATTCYACVPPKSRTTNYQALPTKMLTVDKYVSALRELYAQNQSRPDPGAR